MQVPQRKEPGGGNTMEETKAKKSRVGICRKSDQEIAKPPYKGSLRLQQVQQGV
jgi:hypothetical protein